MQKAKSRIRQVEKLRIYANILPQLNIIALCLGVLFFASLNSFAGKVDVFKKYDYTYRHNGDLYDTAGGYVIKYNQIEAYQGILEKEYSSKSRKQKRVNPYLNCQSYFGWNGYWLGQAKQCR